MYFVVVEENVRDKSNVFLLNSYLRFLHKVMSLYAEAICKCAVGPADLVHR